jgi:SPP1 gp7 family putative phage head morphogenesis protein
MDSVRADIVGILRSAKSPGGVRKKLAQWAKKPAAYDQIGDAIFDPAVRSDLAGQLMVYGHDAKLVKLAAADGTVQPFLDMPWDEALAYFRDRGLMSDRDFETLLKGYAERSDVARKLMLEQIQSTVMARLDDAIASGTSQAQFADDVNSELESLGISQAEPSYLDMVFRTNVQSAYGAGRFRALSDPDVQDAMPYIQFRSVDDARVCDHCSPLHNLVFDAKGELWKEVAPPRHFQCRCSQVSLSRADAEQYEIVDRLPAEYAPVDGFEGPPVARIKSTPRQLPLPANDQFDEALAKQSAQRLPEPVKEAVSGLDDSQLDYLRGGMRDMGPIRGAYDGATPDEANSIAAGLSPARDTGKYLEPIKIGSDVSAETKSNGQDYILEDGRHRLQAAREAGATHIAAIVDGKRVIIPMPATD